MENEAIARQHYAQIRQRLTPATPVALLCIGEQQTVVVCGNEAQPVVVLSLNIGFVKTGETFFKHLPPTPDEMELAIMTVEDEVMRIRHSLLADSALFSVDPDDAGIARISGVKEEDGSWWLSQDEIERTFKRLERVMFGSPASWEGIPLERSFTARLLILREFIHHHGFETLTITPYPSSVA
ncbi:hypothetical protein Bresa_02192|uniref:Uncharacterized protein n=1 Tax=Brenneria salicis ATCC 15712 = DSM 30166 TaxID=714314 RepID=A0A366I1L3_9GAMM|nr:hypothetical protein [Brenneria salicis]NMN91957.1 hypothetical protein [Brenneria salicis ATCC 15712 = DSM 30166]RBP61260.1 hypothetical protein DES54_1241 [Brenneria salicis ATCC 15712 = DSM 30166]RLM30269.1 hypothetical protein BHG07_11375 [Brenneria salicis ATCC 15712 = DSM 30166]